MSLGDLRKRHSSKWRRYPADVLPLHVAEMDFEVAEPIQRLLVDFARRSDLGYLGPLPELESAFGSFAASRWGWQPQPQALKLATDVGVAAVELLRLLCKPGDRVLINTPVYSSFMKWIAEVGLEPHDAPLVEQDGEWRLDLDAIEAAFQSGTRVYLLCNPQNPVGRLHSREELNRVAELAAMHGAVVITDEIHSPLSYNPGEFTPYISVSDAARATGILITSNSKSWNTAGLKAAFLLTESSQLAERLKALPEAMHWRASLLGGFAMVTSYAECEPWLDATVARIELNFALLGDLLKEALPQARIWRQRSTYLAWVDFSGYLLDDPADFLLREARVAVVSGADHAPKSIAMRYQQHVRLNFGTSEDILRLGIAAMATSLADFPRN
jgi:cystathionine beta-lyase